MNILIESILNNKDSDFIKCTEIIENKVTDSVKNKELTNICRKYKNFSSENSQWIIETYRDMLIQERTESLLNNNLIKYLCEKKK